MLRRLAGLGITLVGLYVVWPSLLAAFSSWDELGQIRPAWFAVTLLLEAVSYLCVWTLLRVCLRTGRWFAVATSQLASNAFSRVVPGGAAAGGALQFSMLVGAKAPAAAVGSGLTVMTVLSTATLAALPIVALLALIVSGAAVPQDLARVAWLGAGMAGVLLALGALFLLTDRPLAVVGRTVAWVLARVRPRRAAAAADLPGRLLAERDEVRTMLQSRWLLALAASVGRVTFDYLALVAAIAATGSAARPSLVLLAYAASMVLGMIPITPGGLGFVEAGLTAMLGLAGLPAPGATLATLAYRMVSYWLPLPAGAVAYALFRRRYGAPRQPAVDRG